MFWSIKTSLIKDAHCDRLNSGSAGRGRKFIGRNRVNLVVGWCGRFLFFLLSLVNSDWAYFHCPGTTLPREPPLPSFLLYAWEGFWLVLVWGRFAVLLRVAEINLLFFSNKSLLFFVDALRPLEKEPLDG